MKDKIISIMTGMFAVWIGIMIGCVIIILSKLLITTAFSSELKQLDLHYEEAKGTNRSFEYQGEKKGELGLHFNYAFFKSLDLDTNVNSKLTTSQFRYVELEPTLNLHLTDNLSVYARHRSGHCLDCVYSNIEKYPNENGIGVKLILFGR